MKIKSYIAPNIKEALAQIHKEIGNSALILETRECEGRGFKGFLGKALVEVIAAYPEDVANETSEKDLGDVLEESHDSASDDKDFSGSGSADIVGKSSQSRILTLLNEKIKEKTSEDLGSSITETEIKSQDIKSELLNLKSKETLEEKDSVKANSVNPLHPKIEKIRIDLLDNEIQNEITNLLLDPWTNGKGVENVELDINKIKIDIHDRIANMVSTKNIIENNSESASRKIITFVGPTGVGKTTTLAKVAAKLAIDNNKNVGVITIDTYRIAAVDQLMAYADMIDIPMRVAHTPKELSIAVNEFNDKDYILIDTVGRSQYDEKRIRMLRGLLKILPSPENYLMISAGTRNKEVDDIFTNFNILPIHGFIFTKIDETKSFGMLLNIIVKTKLPTCYVTNGQEVPDDILEASPEVIAGLIVPP